jgi:hypothetical protein
MKITYKLYSAFEQQGKEIATVQDESQANVLEGYYRSIYNTDSFRVTRKLPRQKEERVTGFWEY